MFMSEVPQKIHGAITRFYVAKNLNNWAGHAARRGKNACRIFVGKPEGKSH
jgi:hypothetical protein